MVWIPSSLRRGNFGKRPFNFSSYIISLRYVYFTAHSPQGVCCLLLRWMGCPSSTVPDIISVELFWSEYIQDSMKVEAFLTEGIWMPIELGYTGTCVWEGAFNSESKGFLPEYLISNNSHHQQESISFWTCLPTKNTCFFHEHHFDVISCKWMPWLYYSESIHNFPDQVIYNGEPQITITFLILRERGRQTSDMGRKTSVHKHFKNISTT